ncbi:hypothetical protein [Elizabethkingia meningoseptica]|uniref:hypothetical protein n=1 Tax=Elizabethkingia meningoseptica TaxID=238 RepID=UPI002010F4F6|nr:hypothetical protein [Elizabethkingia meningoseptica]MCL1676193.1 hypothetical protein [Elizabethkingia meningoseptica]MCL1684902.1 hypothetical protein [Elizabethkingia meningoseptica]
MKKNITTVFLLLTNLIFAQKIIVKKSEINNIKDYLRSKDYPSKAIKDLKNILSQMENNEIIINESIPKEIFNITQPELFNSKTKNFQVQENNLVEVNTIPNSNIFYEKIKNSAEKQNLSFQNYKIDNRYIISKNNVGNYLIRGTIELSFFEKTNKNTASLTVEPYYLEYNTKDFVNFIPVRYRSANNLQWIDIDQ